MRSDPVETADPLGGAAKEFFGLSYLFPYQRLVVSNILEAAEANGIPVLWTQAAGACDNVPAPVPEEGLNLGRQIVILPTGAGKSLCFQLPAMLLKGVTLVVYPILSLMADQERRLRERGFSPLVLQGGQSKEERDAIRNKLRSGESSFLIANPEVLLTPGVMEKLIDINIVHIVIDEAHCVSEWGESFRPSYLRIGEIIAAAGGNSPARGRPLITAFTATASAAVLEKIEQYIFGGPVLHIIGNPDRSNITYAAQGCLLRDLAVRDLLKKNEKPAIVFCASRPGTEKLALYLINELREEGLDQDDIRFYHAGLSREKKKQTEDWFFNSGRGILVSTCAYGMGVDKADIRTVIHRDCPPSVEAYLQESGRAGRDGKQSKAILLWGPDDEAQVKRARNENGRRRIEDLINYARNPADCRRSALLSLLNYEGEESSPESHCCDVCEGTSVEDAQRRGRLREETSLMLFFRKNRRAFSLNEAARELAGAGQFHWSAEDAKQAVLGLIKLKKLRVCKNLLWKNKITI
jgi:ATP-dependent DNA helicase RecQ